MESDEGDICGAYSRTHFGLPDSCNKTGNVSYLSGASRVTFNAGIRTSG